MNIDSTRVLQGGWSLAASCALSLLVACNPAGNSPTTGPTPVPGLSPVPVTPRPTPSPGPTPSSGPPTASPTAGPATATPTPNPAAGASTSIRLPDGTRLVLTLPNRFLDGSGQSVRITAQLFDAAGNPIPIGDLRLRFSSSRPELFSVDDQGLITALRDDGFSTITVTIDGTDLSASQLISVFTATGGGSGSGGGGGGSQPVGDESLRLSAGFEGLGLGEFRVNTSTLLAQRQPEVAMDSEGDFVLVWQSHDGNSYDIYGRRYDRAGRAQGPEFRVNYFTAGEQLQPVVAIDADGDFVVAWHQNLNGDYEIYARRFELNGHPQGPEFRVNSYTSGTQSGPAIASDADGDFAIVWTSNYQDGSREGVFGQRFDASGATIDGEFRVNQWTTEVQRNPAIAMDSSGDFLVAWQSFGQDDENYGIYGRRYASGGSLVSNEFHLNLTTTNNQVNPTLALDVDGSFLVAWDAVTNFVAYDIYAIRYNSDFTPQSEEFIVNSYTTGNQRNAQIELDGDGDFVIAWDSYGESYLGNGNRVAYRRFSAEGSPEPEVKLNLFENATTAGSSASSRRPALAGNSAGRFVIGWQSLQEGSDFGIYARLFDELGQAQ